MNRDEFILYMNEYKKARASNPSLSYWLWKANKYEKGTDGIVDELKATSRSSNPDAGNLMFDAMKKDLSIDPNPMIPSETSYFRTESELKSYMNTLRQFMFDNNMINKIDDKVTTKKIQEAIDKLPSELNSVKAAYKQFKKPLKIY